MIRSTVRRSLVLALCLVYSAGLVVKVEVEAEPPKVRQSKSFAVSCYVFVDGAHAVKTSLSWTKNGKPVVSDGRRISFEDEASLRISNAVVADSGVYTCTVRAKANGQSKSATDSTRVTVKGSTSIVPVIDHVSVPEGGSASLECRGQGFSTIFWFHKWEAILENDNFRISYSPSLGKGTLNITLVELSHLGSYQCQGGDKIASIFLTVQKVKKTVVNAFQSNYAAVLMTCNYLFPNESHRANVHISWLKEGVLLKSHHTRSRLFYDEGVVLAIENATCADSGLYTCLIYSEGKLDEVCHTNLIVESYPAPPTNINVELHCDEYSDALHLTWYPSACAADKTFHGYEVTITAFEPEYFSYETKTIFVSNLSCIFDLSRKSAMVKWSCTNCGTLYGVEVVARNAFGKSQRIMPLYLSIKGKGRQCNENRIPILQSLPGIQVWTLDHNCTCSKSAEVLSMTKHVRNSTAKYLSDIMPAQNHLESILVTPGNRAMTVFLYRIGLRNLSVSDSIRVVSKVDSSITADRRRQYSMNVTEDCQLFFADCSALYAEDVKCRQVVSHSCREPKSLRKLRKLCSRP